MFEKIGNSKEDELFLTTGQIEIDAAIRKEKRKEEQKERISRLKELLKENGPDDLVFTQEFLQWNKTEYDIVNEEKDPNEFVEAQIGFQVREAEIFAEAGLEHQKRDLIRKAIDLLDGTEEEGRMDGILYSADRQVENGVIEEKIAKAIDERVEELLKIYKSMKG